MAKARQTANPTTTSDGEADVERIFDAAELPEDAERVVLVARSGRSIAITPDGAGDRLTVRAPGGAIELTIRLTSEGPVVTLAGVTLELAAARDVSIECERFAVHARQGAELEAHAVTIEARRGNVEVKANDDVVIDGERIYLNR